MKRLSIVIPVYNEETTLCSLLDRVVQASLPPAIEELQVVIVDDRSTDNTWEKMQRYEPPAERSRPKVAVDLLRHEQNRGKGAALRTGFERADGDIVLIQDADLEYDPGDYPVLLEPILAGHADVVYGSRFLGGPHRVLFFWHSVGNTMLTLMSNMFTDLNLTDMETCYKVFTRNTLCQLKLVSDRFGIEPELTAKLARAGARIYEVPISYHGRTYAEGKKIGWKDGVSAIWSILRFNLWAR